MTWAVGTWLHARTSGAMALCAARRRADVATKGGTAREGAQ
jgi:hypothetical protein